MGPANCTPGAGSISLTNPNVTSTCPAATLAMDCSAPVCKTVFPRTSSLMPRLLSRLMTAGVPAPSLTYPIDFDRSSVCLIASAVVTSGLGAPARTATPMPLLARSTPVPLAILPSLIKSAMTGCDSNTRSNGSPPSMERFNPADVPYWTLIVRPMLRSYSGSSFSTAARMPLEHNMRISVSWAAAVSAATRMTAGRHAASIAMLACLFTFRSLAIAPASAQSELTGKACRQDFHPDEQRPALPNGPSRLCSGSHAMYHQHDIGACPDPSTRPPPHW